MIPIKPLDVTPNGIVVYTPPKDSNIINLKLDIYYSRNNPVYSWLNCDTGTSRIWEDIQSNDQSGIIFIYQTNSLLELGFYTISLTGFYKDSTSKKGSITMGIIRPKNRLIIGLPYSIHPPIELI